MAKNIACRTEDQVRDSAKIVLGFDAVETKIQQGTGQITTFNQLGFKGINDKPDGWYYDRVYQQNRILQFKHS